MKNIKEILSTDVIEDVEKNVGKHYSEFNELEAMIAMCEMMKFNDEKENKFKELNDTYYNIAWDDYKKLFTDKGFEIGYSEQYKYNSFGEETTEEVILHYNKEKNLVAWAQSYNNMTTINSGKLYGYCKVDNMFEIDGSCGYKKELECYEFDMDVREGLFSKLAIIEESGDFSKCWNKDRFLWFFKLGEEKIKGYDYKKITQEKIDKACEEVRSILGR